jgi:hypothetical protein
MHLVEAKGHRRLMPARDSDHCAQPEGGRGGYGMNLVCGDRSPGSRALAGMEVARALRFEDA